MWYACELDSYVAGADDQHLLGLRTLIIKGYTIPYTILYLIYPFIAAHAPCKMRPVCTHTVYTHCVYRMCILQGRAPMYAHPPCKTRPTYTVRV